VPIDIAVVTAIRCGSRVGVALDITIWEGPCPTVPRSAVLLVMWFQRLGKVVNGRPESNILQKQTAWTCPKPRPPATESRLMLLGGAEGVVPNGSGKREFVGGALLTLVLGVRCIPRPL
jgi:hypothetical protein